MMGDHAESWTSRRDFLSATTSSIVAGALASAAMTACASADATKAAPASGAPGQRVLIKGGVVLTMERTEAFEKLGKKPQGLRLLLRELRGSKKAAALLVVLSFAGPRGSRCG